MKLPPKKYLILFVSVALLIWYGWLVTTNSNNSERLVFAQDSPDNLAITRYSSPDYAQINSYWIETTEGIIVVDAQLFLSQAGYDN